jgi:hypothetical protein
MFNYGEDGCIRDVVTLFEGTGVFKNPQGSIDTVRVISVSGGKEFTTIGGN